MDRSETLSREKTKWNIYFRISWGKSNRRKNRETFAFVGLDRWALNMEDLPVDSGDQIIYSVIAGIKRFISVRYEKKERGGGGRGRRRFYSETPLITIPRAIVNDHAYYLYTVAGGGWICSFLTV